MGLRRLLARSAAMAPASVFPVVGRGARSALLELTADPRLRVAATPRAASVLLVAGGPVSRLVRPALAVHDQMSDPRGTVWWTAGSSAGRLARLFPNLTVVDARADVVDTVVRVHGQLMRGERASDPSVLPDTDPAPWRGIGPYGQGGKGMTGGVPYGRPMAGRAPDRDGLELDQLDLQVGPFFAPFPPGFDMRVRLQGDVVQQATIGPNPFRRWRPVDGQRHFHSALSEPVSIRVLEVARARHHLGWLGHALRVLGLDALGRRALGLAGDASPGAVDPVRRLWRLIEGTGSVGWATAGAGPLPLGVARLAGGPVARASGVVDDVRARDREYEALGFAPIVQREGDVRARWRQRLAEAEQALELAGRAGAARTSVTGEVESPRGRLTPEGSSAASLLDALPSLLAGLEWGDAIKLIVSLDLDLEEAAT